MTKIKLIKVKFPAVSVALTQFCDRVGSMLIEAYIALSRQ